MTVYITRCPACQQAFKINENQLQAKNGQVRCGFCQNVFNARELLYKSIDLEGGLNRIEREAEVERQGIANMKSLADQLKGFDSVDDNQGLVSVRSEIRNGPERLDIINGGSNVSVISHPASSAVPSESETDEVEDEDSYEEETKKRSSKTWLWLIVALIAIVAIVLKVLAANQNACEKITCEPRHAVTPLDAPLKPESTSASDKADVAAVSIVSHSLQQVTGNQYAISVDLKNSSEANQAYPILTVVLKGEKEDIITRRRINPSEYLTDSNQTLAPQSQQTVSIAFDMTDADPATLSVEIEPVL